MIGTSAMKELMHVSIVRQSKKTSFIIHTATKITIKQTHSFDLKN